MRGRNLGLLAAIATLFGGVKQDNAIHYPGKLGRLERVKNNNMRKAGNNKRRVDFYRINKMRKRSKQTNCRIVRNRSYKG